MFAHESSRRIACDTFEISAEETLTRKVKHVAHSFHTELVVVEYGLDFEDDVLVDDSRCRLLSIAVGSRRDVFGRHVEQFGVELHFAFCGIVLAEGKEEFVEHLTEE